MTGRDAGTIRVRVADVSAWRTLEYLLASGDFLFVQTPAACPIPRGYFRVRSFSGQRVRQQGAPRYCDIALTEIAAPGPDIVTASATWATVVALYGTWADVVVAQPTWEDLLTLAGSPTEVIVP